MESRIMGHEGAKDLGVVVVEGRGGVSMILSSKSEVSLTLQRNTKLKTFSMISVYVQSCG